MKKTLRNLGGLHWGSCVILCLLFLGTKIEVVSAQVSATPATGHVSGRVSDSGGLELGGALIKFSATFRGMRITVISGKDGVFGVDLPAGAYRVTAELRGYANTTQNEFEVKPGQKAELKLVLNPTRDGFVLESQINGSELLSLLPEESRETLIQRCGGCHTSGVLGGKRMTESGWADLVARMASLAPAGRGSGAIAPWAENPWSAATEVLAKHFAPGTPSYRYEPFPIHNTLDNLSKVVIKEYQLKRREINVHDVAVDSSGKRIWYNDQENARMVKTGLFGWYDPVTGESKEYQVPQCHGFSGQILADKSGRVWIGCRRALAYWDPKTDQLEIFPMTQFGMGSLWAVDSNANAYAAARGTFKGEGRDSAYIAKFDLQTQEWTTFKVPTPWGTPYELKADSKDNIWFTQIATDKIGKLDPRTGKITEYPVPTTGGARAAPRRFSIDSKDNIWFTEFLGNKIGMVDSQTGEVTQYEVPTPFSLPYAIGVDRNDVVWFGQMAAIRLGRFDPKTKTFREYPIPDRLASVKNLEFTYSNGKQIVWGSHRTGPKIFGFEVPEER